MRLLHLVPLTEVGLLLLTGYEMIVPNDLCQLEYDPLHSLLKTSSHHELMYRFTASLMQGAGIF